MGQMLCKEFYFKLWWTFCSSEQNWLGSIGRGLFEEHLCDIILIWNTSSGGDVSVLAAAAILFSGVKPFGQNLAVGIIRNTSVKLFFNLNQWFRKRCCSKTFLIYSSDSHFVQWSRTIFRHFW